MGWAIFALLALAIGVAMWRFGRAGRGGLELVSAALLVAAAGYAWQGSPRLAGARPAPRAPADPAADAFAVQREALGFASVGADADILAAADSLTLQGAGDYAVATLRAGLNARPRSAELWVGLANALVRRADGFVTPAADFAFRQADRLAPKSPAARYFRAIAYAQMGQFDTAEAIWRNLLAEAPENAPWRLLVGRNLMLLDAIRTAR